MLWDVPVAGVNEIPVTSTLNERREVDRGGVGGVATSVRLRVALLPPPPPPPVDSFSPLHEASPMDEATRKKRTDLRFIQHPTVE